MFFMIFIKFLLLDMVLCTVSNFVYAVVAAVRFRSMTFWLIVAVPSSGQLSEFGRSLRRSDERVTLHTCTRRHKSHEPEPWHQPTSHRIHQLSPHFSKSTSRQNQQPNMEENSVIVLSDDTCDQETQHSNSASFAKKNTIDLRYHCQTLTGTRLRHRFPRSCACGPRCTRVTK